MKKYLFASLAIIASTSVYAQDDDAFDQGFEHGYQAVHPSLVAPFPPLYNGLPNLHQSEFDRGIAAGVKRGREDNGDDDE